MNRRIRKELKAIREACWNIDNILGEISEEEPTEEEPDLEYNPETGFNWSDASEEAKEGVYLAQLKELSTLKDIAIVGQVKTLFELKSYVKKDKSGSGLVYRIVLSDETGDITVIAFDDMATRLKEYTVGQYLRITNAWKVEKNKHGVYELHIGKFAKIEVVE
jgi:hypothetical protein